jgi:hypothetical protein
LFECLNIDYNEETIKQFMQSITADESGLAVSGKPVEETLTIEDLNQMGTHEHKPFFDASSMSDVAQLIKHKIRPQYLLGKYALLIGAV